jgi:hypothetical protein
VVPAYTEEQLDAAIAALADPERLREAELMVAGAAPKLQKVLMAAIKEEDWSREEQAGMLVGVAVGWALANELREANDKE